MRDIAIAVAVVGIFAGVCFLADKRDSRMTPEPTCSVTRMSFENSGLMVQQVDTTCINIPNRNIQQYTEDQTKPREPISGYN